MALVGIASLGIGGCANTGTAVVTLTPLVMPSVPVVVEATATTGRLVIRNLGDDPVHSGAVMVSDDGRLVTSTRPLSPLDTQETAVSGITFVYLHADPETTESTVIRVRLEGVGGGLALRLHPVDSLRPERIGAQLPEISGSSPGLITLAEAVILEGPETNPESGLLDEYGEINPSPQEGQDGGDPSKAADPD